MHRRTPNHHRTGLIGDDYPIDPYKRGEMTDDPYNRYWTEESMTLSARKSNPDDSDDGDGANKVCKMVKGKMLTPYERLDLVRRMKSPLVISADYSRPGSPTRFIVNGPDNLKLVYGYDPDLRFGEGAFFCDLYAIYSDVSNKKIAGSGTGLGAGRDAIGNYEVLAILEKYDLLDALPIEHIESLQKAKPFDRVNNPGVSARKSRHELSARKSNPEEEAEEPLSLNKARAMARNAIGTGRDYLYKAKRAVAPIVVGVYAAPLAPVASKLISMTPDERPDDFGDKIADKVFGERKANYGHGRTPNHHRTGLIGDDYPIDPYKRGEMTDDPYNRYWTEESMTLSARKSNPSALYSVSVNGRPVYSSHIKDQAMRRFMHQRSAGAAEVTLSIDGDVAYRTGRGGAMRVGNPPPGKFTIDGRLAENRNYKFVPRANLQAAQLGELDLRGADLTGANLKYADLRHTDLRDAKLDGADFTGADLRQANFSQASLENTIFSEALMIGTIFEDCDLDYVQLNAIDASYADFDGASMIGAKFKDADLTRAHFNKTDLSKADFERANLRRAEFYGADLSDTNFRSSDLRGAYYLESARNAGKADFSYAQAYREDLGPFLQKYPDNSFGFAYTEKPVETLVRGHRIPSNED